MLKAKSLSQPRRACVSGESGRTLLSSKISVTSETCSSSVPYIRTFGYDKGRRGPQVVCAANVARPVESTSKDVQSSFSTYRRSPMTTMAKGGGGEGKNMGSSGSLGVMEKSKLQFVMPTPTPEKPRLDDGGSGGDIGNHNRNGGGGGDGGGDDDDYRFGEGGEGDGEGEKKESLLRTPFAELYDKASILAVLQEWMKAIHELPLILRQSVEMGLFSSAQLVRFFSMDVRPNITRNISRTLPPMWARGFVGRMMADPAFTPKLVLDTLLTAVASLHYEHKARRERFTKEADLVAINTLGLAAATAATVWLLAPTRSFGAVHKFPWQKMLDSLPNHAFDASGPLREYTGVRRVGAFFAKMAELSAVGALAGTVTASLSAAVVMAHKRVDPSYEPSVPVPSVGRSSAGLAAYFALNANTRYQLLGGLDRFLFDRSNLLWLYMATSTAGRVASTHVGEMSRFWWQGLPEASTTTITQPAPVTRRVKRVRRVRKAIPAGEQHSAALRNAAAADVDSIAAADASTSAPEMTSAAQADSAVAAAPMQSAAVDSFAAAVTALSVPEGVSERGWERVAMEAGVEQGVKGVDSVALPQ